MPRDNDGIFSRTNGVFQGSNTWDQQANSGDKFINSGRHDTHDQDLADGLSDSLSRSGKGAMQTTLDMANNRVRNVGSATQASDGPRTDQVQNSVFTYLTNIGGTANAVTAQATPTLSAYAEGQFFSFKVGTTNTGAVTLNIDSRGASMVKDRAGNDLSPGDWQATQVVEVFYDGGNFVSLTASQVAMIGEMRIWGSSTLPSGWLFCDGAAISRTTYANLFSGNDGSIGTTFGVGDGSTTFNVPDLRGRFPIGTGQLDGTGTNRTLGGKGGSESVSITEAQLPSHSHTVTNIAEDTADPVNNRVIVNSGGNLAYFDSVASKGTTATGSGQAHDNMSPFLGINFIIYSGV